MVEKNNRVGQYTWKGSCIDLSQFRLSSPNGPARICDDTDPIFLPDGRIVSAAPDIQGLRCITQAGEQFYLL